MRKSLGFVFCLFLTLIAFQSLRINSVRADSGANWLQWGRTPQHNGASSAVGVIPGTQLANILYDPFVAQAKAESKGELLAHYQVPLIDGNLVFLEYKTGTYTSCNPPGSGQPYPCGPDAWNGEIWNERAYQWRNGSLIETWNYASDWKPEPNSNAGGRNETKGVGLGGWEPVFHAAVGNGFIYVPGASGAIHKINESDGTVAADFLPFGSHANVFVSGPLTLDAAGNLYYNVLALDNEFPWTAEPRGSWLVKISPQGFVTKASYTSLIPDEIQLCVGGLAPCGLQRAALNVAPVLSPDGQTVYTVSRAQFFLWSSYLIAANTKDLSPKWDTYLFGKVHPGEAVYVTDLASSSPSVAPDGSILFGALSSVNGFMMKFGAAGNYEAAFNFGWDSTPAIYAHDGTYSVILKDNLYGNQGPYFIAQLKADMVPEWTFVNNSIDADHPHGYEWCVNAPAVDANGTVYVNSEDGNVYVIAQGGKQVGKMFLQSAVAAAYTPVAIGPDGKVYAENNGNVFVLGP